MDAGIYEVEAEAEATHWWFVGRRRLFAAEIARLGLDPNGAVLDIGTSTGTNLRMLRELGFHNVQGLDSSEEAVRYCAAKGFDAVRRGDVCDMPFSSDSFDLVLATDVIEHVEDDVQAIREIARIMKPRGASLISVPAFRCLWGLQDDLGRHKRRYRQSELIRLVSNSGLRIDRQYYFNYLLFLPIWLGRRAIRWFAPGLKNEAQVNSPLLNLLLSKVFALDTATAPLLHAPFGVSALVVARKDTHLSEGAVA